MPKCLWLSELSERLVRDDPAAHGIAASLLNGLANLRVCAFRKHQQADAGDRKDMRTHAHLQCPRRMIFSQRQVASRNMASAAILT
jgi:hypothetical protein